MFSINYIQKIHVDKLLAGGSETAPHFFANTSTTALSHF